MQKIKELLSEFYEVTELKNGTLMIGYTNMNHFIIKEEDAS